MRQQTVINSHYVVAASFTPCTEQFGQSTTRRGIACRTPKPVADPCASQRRGGNSRLKSFASNFEISLRWCSRNLVDCSQLLLSAAEKWNDIELKFIVSKENVSSFNLSEAVAFTLCIIVSIFQIAIKLWIDFMDTIWSRLKCYINKIYANSNLSGKLSKDCRKWRQCHKNL